MSFYAAKRVIGDSPWTPELLEQVFRTVGLVLGELWVVMGTIVDGNGEPEKYVTASDQVFRFLPWGKLLRDFVWCFKEFCSSGVERKVFGKQQ